MVIRRQGRSPSSCRTSCIFDEVFLHNFRRGTQHVTRDVIIEHNPFLKDRCEQRKLTDEVTEIIENGHLTKRSDKGSEDDNEIFLV